MDQIANSVALVVDDDHNMCEVLKTILEADGFRVITAYSGEEALERFGEVIVDVVITDVKMEGMTGIDLLNRIKRLDPTVKVIVMTAFGGYDMVLKSLQAGAYDYIAKPVEDHSRLSSTVRKAYEHVMLARDNELLLTKLKTSHSKLAIANSRLVTLNKQLKKLAVTDSLTGMYNRRFIDLALKREFERYCRYKDPFTLLMLDIDRFKQFNDTYGHDGGDQALIRVAQLIQKSARNTDIVGRYGGEEFYMLLTKTSPENAEVVAERVRSMIEQSDLEIDGKPVDLTVSIGLAGLDGVEVIDSLRDILVRADDAMYLAKKNGRNTVHSITSVKQETDSPEADTDTMGKTATG